VLNGIGGNTIKEAMQNLPYDEVYIWQAYQRKYGTLSIARRVDYAGALISYMQGKTAKPESTIEDFMFREIEEKTDDEINEGVLAFFGGLSDGN
jgi:hypothetical protein